MLRITYKHLTLLSLMMLALLSYYYKNIKKLPEYLLFKDRNNRFIIAFGDSLTEGLHARPKFRRFSPYTIKLQELINSYIKTSRSKLNVTVTNYGVSGEKVTKTMKNRLKRTLKENKADLVIILAGTNDLVDLANQAADHSQPDRISNDLHTLHLICYYKDIVTAALTIPETAIDVQDNNSSFSRARNWVNNELVQFMRLNENGNSSKLIDISSNLPRRNNSELWDDGLHLTPRGYEKMAELIFEGIKSIIFQWIKDAERL